MSTLKVNKIENTGTTDGGIEIDSTGHVQIDGVQLPTTGALSNRNLIINGAMQVAQRGTSAVTANNKYAVDRYRTDFDTNGSFSLEQSTTTPADFKNSVKWTTTTADTSLASTQYAYFRQRIEGNVMSHLNWGSSDAKAITVSFYVRSSVTGTFGGAVWNNDFNRSYAFSYTISSADTWERKAITIPGDTSGTWLTDNSCGINLTVLASAGSTYQGTAGVWASSGNVTATGTVNVMNTLNSTYFVTGVQLEVGDKATPFEHRSFGDELARCQRYYSKSYSYQDAPGTNTSDSLQGLRNWDTSDRSDVPANVRFPVEMRAAPAVTIYTKDGSVDNLSQSTDGSSHESSKAISSVRGIGRAGYSTLACNVNVTGLRFYIWHWTASAEI